MALTFKIVFAFIVTLNLTYLSVESLYIIDYTYNANCSNVLYADFIQNNSFFSGSLWYLSNNNTLFINGTEYGNDTYCEDGITYIIKNDLLSYNYITIESSCKSNYTSGSISLKNCLLSLTGLYEIDFCNKTGAYYNSYSDSKCKKFISTSVTTTGCTSYGDNFYVNSICNNPCDSINCSGSNAGHLSNPSYSNNSTNYKGSPPQTNTQPSNSNYKNTSNTNNNPPPISSKPIQNSNGTQLINWFIMQFLLAFIILIVHANLHIML